MMTIEKLQEANALYERIEKAKKVKNILDDTEKAVRIYIPGTGVDISEPNLRECIANAVCRHIEDLERTFSWL